jgi:hypothetical protein
MLSELHGNASPDGLLFDIVKYVGASGGEVQDSWFSSKDHRHLISEAASAHAVSVRKTPVSKKCSWSGRPFVATHLEREGQASADFVHRMAIDERVTNPRIETEIVPHLPDRPGKSRPGFGLRPHLVMRRVRAYFSTKFGSTGGVAFRWSLFHL